MAELDAAKVQDGWPVTGDRVIRWTAASAVLTVATIAATVSYLHIKHLALANGQSALSARLLPVSVDGAVLAASMVMLDAARRGVPAPALARIMLTLGVAATLGANAAIGAAHGVVGVLVSAWPAVAFLGRRRWPWAWPGCGHRPYLIMRPNPYPRPLLLVLLRPCS